MAIVEQNFEEDVDCAAAGNAKVWLNWRSSTVVLLPRDESEWRTPILSNRSEKRGAQ